MPYRRSVGLVALLITEMVTVTIRFDGRTIRADRPWFGLVARSGWVAQLCLSVGLATLLVAGPRCYKELKRKSARLGHAQWSVPAILGNLLAFVAFYRLSASIFEGDGSANPLDWLLVALWVLAASATVVLWAMAVVPADLWVAVFYQSAGSLVIGPALGAGAYMAGLLAQNQWKPLSRPTLLLVDGLLKLVFTNTFCWPDRCVIGTHSFRVAISPMCSGYEGVGLVAAFVAIALWAFRGDFRFPRALALLPLALVLIWVANAVRIASLIALGTWGYPNLAVAAFHSLAGWFLLLVIGLGLTAFARRMPFFATSGTGK